MARLLADLQAGARLVSQPPTPTVRRLAGDIGQSGQTEPFLRGSTRCRGPGRADVNESAIGTRRTWRC